jgi:hypothetical protein
MVAITNTRRTMTIAKPKLIQKWVKVYADVTPGGGGRKNSAAHANTPACEAIFAKQ